MAALPKLEFNLSVVDQDKVVAEIRELLTQFEVERRRAQWLHTVALITAFVFCLFLVAR